MLQGASNRHALTQRFSSLKLGIVASLVPRIMGRKAESEPPDG
jgi:hypothetical protein